MKTQRNFLFLAAMMGLVLALGGCASSDDSGGEGDTNEGKDAGAAAADETGEGGDGTPGGEGGEGAAAGEGSDGTAPPEGGEGEALPEGGEGTAEGAEGAAEGVPGYRQLHAKFFSQGCSTQACHSGEKGIAGLSFTDLQTSYENLVGAPPSNPAAHKDGLHRVTAGELEKSLLWWKLAHPQDELTAKGYGAAMPLAGVGAPGPNTLQAIEKWIVGGAPLEGEDFEADFGTGEGSWVDCDATAPEEEMHKCFEAEGGAAKYLRFYSPKIEVPPHIDAQFCSYTTYRAPDDLYFDTWSGQQMKGGHHTVLYVVNAQSDDPAPHECTDYDMTNVRYLAGAGGRGAKGQTLPEGMSVKLRKGEQIMIQSHYINTEDTPITVMDMVELRYTTLGANPTIVDSFAINNSGFSIPPATEHTSVKECTTPVEMNIIKLLGHTHEAGVLFTLELERQGEAPELLYTGTDGKLLRDSPPELDFAENPLVFKPGDIFRMTCVWNNELDRPVGFPEEMCVTFGFYYPGHGWILCDEGDQQFSGGDLDPPPADSCPPKGTVGNSIGVGKYCETAGDCAGQEAGFCIGMFAPGNNYCSIIQCQSDAECGEDATCVQDTAGSACVPIMCQ